jgi:predicted RNA-binding protein (TIGR00451 family)
MEEDIERLKRIADFQFGYGAGKILFPKGTKIIYSKNTGRVRHTSFNGELTTTFRPNNGKFALSIKGAEKLVSGYPSFDYFVTVIDEVAEFPCQGKDVFAKHVVYASDSIRPLDEVVVVNSEKKVLAVGRSMLNKKEMTFFKKGVAVRVRHGYTQHK